MKKTFYILLFLLTLPLLGLTQNDTIIQNKNNVFKNQLDINVELLGVAFGYKKRIYSNLFAIAKIGAGASTFRVHYKKDNFSDTKVEAFNTSLLLHYSFKNLLLIETGPRYSSLYYELGLPNSNRFEWELGLYAGLRKIQIGIRFGFFGAEDRGIGFKNQNEKYSNSFLIIRIPLTKW